MSMRLENQCDVRCGILKPRPIETKGETIVITLSNGEQIHVETWERTPEMITIRCNRLLIKPRADNTVDIGCGKMLD